VRDSLPENHQKIFQAACCQIHTTILAEYERMNALKLQEIYSLPQIKVEKFSPDILQEAKSSTEKLLNDYASSDPTFHRVYTEWSKFRKNIQHWHEVNKT